VTSKGRPGLQQVAERLDGTAVHRAVLHELREVMIEAGVDHAVGSGGTTAQAVQVFQRTPQDLGARGSQRRSLVVRPTETEDFMARRDQILYDSRANPAGGSSDKNTHD